MRIFHKNATLAKSRFWFFLRAKKIKKAHGEIITVQEVYEPKASNVKNYGIVIRYTSKVGIVNMYKEYRDVTLCGAVSQLYQEMAAKHKAIADTIHIVKATVVADKDVKRAQTQTYATASIRYPLTSFRYRAPQAQFKSTTRASRPTNF